MPKLLYINASPRGDVSASVNAARLFIDALPDAIEVEQIDLIDAHLPHLTAEIASAKVKFPSGAALTDEERKQWGVVESLVEQFKAADHYLFGLPMWNFSIPYTFKHYIDMITHPGLLFARDDKGIHGLASGSATVIYSRGGDYSPKDGKPDPYDFQSPYVKAWLALVGLSPVNEVLVQTTMAGPDAAKASVEGATPQLQTIAGNLA